MKATYAEQKAYQESQKIKDVYYDPFEKNPTVTKTVSAQSKLIETQSSYRRMR